MPDLSEMKHSRAKVVLIAQSWIGTPYHHQASLRGAGCDCLGLVRGVFRELYGFEAQVMPSYSRDWCDVGEKESLLNAGREHLLASEGPNTGDVLIFRFNRLMVAKHTAIFIGDDRMIHAVENAPVCEVQLGRWWRRHIAGCFKFPGCID